MVDDRTSVVDTARGAALVAVEGACLVAAGGAAAWLAWALLTPTGSTGAIAPPPVSSFAADIAALRERPDPFLRTAPTAPSQSGATGTASAEGFTLHSTRAMGDLRSSAILSASNLPQRSYVVGERIGDATLVEVGARHVELDQNGRRIRIAFPEAPASSLIPAKAGTQQPETPPQPQSADRAALINAMSLKSVDRGNGRIGLEIIPRGNPAILADVGLAAGDIVLAVNGRAIDTQTFTEHRSAIMSGAEVELSFERAGRVMTTRIGE